MPATPTIIPCDQIVTESNRLQQLFKACYRLTGDDLDDLVALTYSASLCGTGEGSIPTFDQNNIIRYIVSNSRTDQEPSAVTVLNTMNSFVIDEKEIAIFPHLTTRQSEYTTDVITDYYLLRPGKGTYGAGGTSLIQSSLFWIRGGTVASLPSSAGTSTPPRMWNLYSSDVGGSTISRPDLILNGDVATITISDGQDTYVACFNTQNDLNSEWKIYRFIGVAGDYGAGVDSSVIGDFLLVETINETFQEPHPDGRIAIREITVPGPITTGGFTSVSEAINGSFRGQITVADTEWVMFLITRFVDTTNPLIKTVVAEKWVWNKGAQVAVNTGSVDSDYYLIESTTKKLDGTDGSNSPEIYYTEWADITDTTAASSAVNSISGVHRVVLNNNLVLVKISLDDGSNSFKIWEFTGAVTGNGTYGVSGLVAVAGDFNPVPFVDSTDVPDLPVQAVDVIFDDSSALLSANNVQDAIDNLDTIVDAITTGSAFAEITTANPNYNISIDAYRSGKIGLGSVVLPTSLLDIKTTQALGDNGVKIEYIDTAGRTARVQFGGENILSEAPVSIPTSGVHGIAMIYNGDTNSPNLNAYSVLGDFGLLGAQKNFGLTQGISKTDGSAYALMFAQSLVEDNEDETQLKFKALSAVDSDFAYMHINSKGYKSQVAIPGYGLEPLIDIKTINNDTEVTQLYISPHVFSCSNLWQLPDYGQGTFVQGFTHTDSLIKTGTIPTVIGAAAYSLAIDAAGNLMESGLNTSLSLQDTINVSATTNTGFIVSNSSASENIIVNDDTGGNQVIISPVHTKFDYSSAETILKGHATAGTLSTITLPYTTGTAAISVNGVAADASGNVSLPTTTVKVSLSAADLKSIGTIPIDAIAAQGADTLISITKCVGVLTYGSVAFDNNSLDLTVDGATQVSVRFSGWINGVADSIYTQTHEVGETLLNNTKVVITGTNSVATGDSSIDLYITYEIITL